MPSAGKRSEIISAQAWRSSAPTGDSERGVLTKLHRRDFLQVAAGAAERPDVRSGAVSALPSAGGVAGHAPERSREMGLIRKADLDGNLREGTVGFQQ